MEAAASSALGSRINFPSSPLGDVNSKLSMPWPSSKAFAYTGAHSNKGSLRIRSSIESNKSNKLTRKAQCSLATCAFTYVEGDIGAAAHTNEEKIGVLLLNLGGPDSLDDVQPFLFNFFADPVVSVSPTSTSKVYIYIANMDDFHSPEEVQLPNLLHEPRNMLKSGELLAAARKQQLDVLSQLGNNPNVPLWGRLVDQDLMGLQYNPTADLPSVSSSSAPLLPTTELGLIQPPQPAPLAPVEVPLARDTNSQVEEVLLKELEQMGFKQVEMNKTVLRKNDYDFEKSLDELCNVSEWDLLLEEMRGMGFVDGEANKRVLTKNNGSLKHAVMDLITRENV